MPKIKRIPPLTEAEQAALRRGLKAISGFTVRRSQMLLWNAEGLTCPQIAVRLGCSDQVVRNVLHAFEREGLGCIQAKSHRPHHISSQFNDANLAPLAELVHHSPREYGLSSSRWSLQQLAEVSFRTGVTKRPVSYETIRTALKRLGLNWKQMRTQISSHDAHYTLKKTP